MSNPTDSPPKKQNKLSDQQRLFCSEYCVDFNGSQAAIRAGYSEKTSDQQASRLLTSVKIQHEVAKNLGERFEATELTVDYVIQGLMTLYGQCAGLIPIKTESGKSTKYIHKERGAGKALELLGKYLKMYTDNINLGASNSLAAIMKELSKDKPNATK